MRVGERTDFNKLFINIETDGSITPQEALKRAVAILMEQFRAVGENGTLEIEEKVSDETAEAPKKKRGRPKKVKLVE